MIKDALIEIFERDIHKLEIEINSYANEDNIWLVEGNIKNSAGNLCLHLTGNLRHLIGNVLGKNEFTRDREAEFAVKGIPKKEIIKTIEETSAVVSETLQNMTEHQFNAEYPYEIFNRKMSTNHLLINLIAHLNYHLGQINYHRRMIEK